MIVLMTRNQPYSDAMKVPCSIVLELIHSSLEESLTTLDKEKADLARKQARAIIEYGSVQNMTQQLTALMKETATPDTSIL